MAFQLEFLHARGVIDAPERADRALVLDLPGLIVGFEQIIVPAQFLGGRQEGPHEGRLVGEAGDRALLLAAFRGPARFADDDRHAGELVLEDLEPVLDMADRAFERNAFPIGQHVDAEEIDFLGEIRIGVPDVPGLGGRDLDAPRQFAADFLDVGVQLLDRHVAAQDRLVADEHPVDRDRIGADDLQRRLDLLLVVGAVGADPDAERDLHAEFVGDGRQLVEAARHRIGAHPVGRVLELLEVGANPFLAVVEAVVLGVAVARIVGEAADRRVPVRRVHRAVERRPSDDRRHAGDRQRRQRARPARPEQHALQPREDPRLRLRRHPDHPTISRTPRSPGSQAAKAIARRV